MLDMLGQEEQGPYFPHEESLAIKRKKKLKSKTPKLKT